MARLQVVVWKVVEASALASNRPDIQGQVLVGPREPQGVQAIVPPGVLSRTASGEDPFEDPAFARRGWRWLTWPRSLYADVGGPRGILPPTKHQEVALGEVAMLIQLEAPGQRDWLMESIRNHGSVLREIARPDSLEGVIEINEIGERMLAELRLDAAPIFGDAWVRQHLASPTRSLSG